MSHMFHQVISIISKPPSQRGVPEIEFVLPWIRKHGDLLQDMGKNVLIDILQNCDYQKVSEKCLIIRQGEIGDCFYVILNGSVVVYIDPNLSGEEDEVINNSGLGADDSVRGKEKKERRDNGDETKETLMDADGEENGEAETVENKNSIDRSIFGKFIMKYESGKSFGEIALISEDSVRNASIIADEISDLLVIHRDLYNRSLKAFQEEEYAERREFVSNHPLFGKWSPRFRHLLEMSLRREVFTFDETIVKQGDEFSGLYFIRKGHAKVMIQPNRHKHQYKEMMPFVAENDVFEVERLRPGKNASRLSDDLSRRSHGLIKESVMVRRRGGYVAAEKQMSHKSVMLCSVENGDSIGDVELLMDLPTYMQSVVCTSQCEVYILDVKNIERLLAKKNPQTLEMMKFGVITKLRSRSKTVQGAQVPFLKHLLFRMTEYRGPELKKLPDLKPSKALPDTEILDQVMLEAFKQKKASLVRPYVPDGLYYKTLMEEKAKTSPSAALSMTLMDRMALRAGRYPRRRNARSRVTLKDLQRQTEERHRRMSEDLLAERALKELVVPPTPVVPSAEKWRVRSESHIRDLSSDVKIGSDSPESVSMNTGRRKQLSMSVPNLRVTSDHEKDRGTNGASDYGGKGLRPVREVTEPPHSRESSRDNGGEETYGGKGLRPVREVTEPSLSRESSRDNGGEEKLMSSIENDDVKDKEELSVEHDGSQLKTEEEPSDPTGSKGCHGEGKRSVGFTEPAQNDGKKIRRSSVVSAPEVKGDQSSEGTSTGESSNTILVTELMPKRRDEMDGRTSVSSALDVISQHSESASRPNFAKMKFVNSYVQHRMKALASNSEYHDWETSEPKLKGLEERVHAFNERYTKHQEDEAKPKKTVLPPLRRFKVKEDLRMPKPGGRVIIRRKQCHFANCKYTVKDHNHTKYHMVQSLPEMDKVKKTQVVINYYMLRAAEKKTRRHSTCREVFL